MQTQPLQNHSPLAVAAAQQEAAKQRKKPGPKPKAKPPKQAAPAPSPPAAKAAPRAAAPSRMAKLQGRLGKIIAALARETDLAESWHSVALASGQGVRIHGQLSGLHQSLVAAKRAFVEAGDAIVHLVAAGYQPPDGRPLGLKPGDPVSIKAKSAKRLVAKGIATQEQLAELSVVDVVQGAGRMVYLRLRGADGFELYPIPAFAVSRRAED